MGVGRLLLGYINVYDLFHGTLNLPVKQENLTTTFENKGLVVKKHPNAGYSPSD
jgi:hypothetical protein